jgi:hypothetical protein
MLEPPFVAGAVHVIVAVVEAVVARTLRGAEGSVSAAVVVVAPVVVVVVAPVVVVVVVPVVVVVGAGGAVVVVVVVVVDAGGADITCDGVHNTGDITRDEGTVTHTTDVPEAVLITKLAVPSPFAVTPSNDGNSGPTIAW